MIYIPMHRSFRSLLRGLHSVSGWLRRLVLPQQKPGLLINYGGLYMKKLLTIAIIIMLLTGCSSLPAATDPVETQLSASEMPASPPPDPSPSPAVTPSPAPTPVPSPTPNTAYEPTLTAEDWEECFSRVENIVKVDDVSLVDIDFSDDRNTIFVFFTFSADKSQVSKDGITVLCSATIAALDEIAREYDGDIKPVNSEENYYGGLMDRYHLAIDFTDKNFRNITTLYLMAGEHSPMFF